MKEHPILFSTPMVQAILAGRKTQTRRVIKDETITGPLSSIEMDTPDFLKNGQSGMEQFAKWQPGDVLWVRESFNVLGYAGGSDIDDLQGVTVEFADLEWHHAQLSNKEWDKFQKWKNKCIKRPSLFLFKSLSRIWLQIEDVRVERLQEIDSVDAIDEGILNMSQDWVHEKFPDYAREYHHWDPERHGNMPPLGPSPKERFTALWESINGPESWEENPWVWVVKFKVLSTTGRND